MLGRGLLSTVDGVDAIMGTAMSGDNKKVVMAPAVPETRKTDAPEPETDRGKQHKATTRAEVQNTAIRNTGESTRTFLL